MPVSRFTELSTCKELSEKGGGQAQYSTAGVPRHCCSAVQDHLAARLAAACRPALASWPPCISSGGCFSEVLEELWGNGRVELQFGPAREHAEAAGAHHHLLACSHPTNKAAAVYNRPAAMLCSRRRNQCMLCDASQPLAVPPPECSLTLQTEHTWLARHLQMCRPQRRHGARRSLRCSTHTAVVPRKAHMKRLCWHSSADLPC